MWLRIIAAHSASLANGRLRRLSFGERGRYANARSGVLYVMGADRRSIAVAIAGSPAAAVKELRLETEWSTGHIRQSAYYLETDGIEVDQLRDESPVLLKPGSPLQRGRPQLLWSQADASTVAESPGVYRIYHDDGDGGAEVYIGKTRNLRDQLKQHADSGQILQWGGWGVDAVYCVEVIKMEEGQYGVAPLQVDLSAAELAHITRTKDRLAADSGMAPGGRPLSHVDSRAGDGNDNTGAEFSTAYVWTSAVTPELVGGEPRIWRHLETGNTVYATPSYLSPSAFDDLATEYDKRCQEAQKQAAAQTSPEQWRDQDSRIEQLERTVAYVHIAA